MIESSFEFDEIGVWSELKLEIVEQYGAAYTKAFNKTQGLKKYYIDGFSGRTQVKDNGLCGRGKSGASLEGLASFRRVLFHRS
jgi:hypothetical protein